MTISSRMISAFLTTLPGLFFFIFFLRTGWIGREYWWRTYLAVLVVLLFISLLLGFALPTVFQKLGLHRPEIWIFAQGLLAWALAIFVLGLLNLTPLCVGQNNGDGNNDIALCSLMTALSGAIYTPLYLAILTISSLIGHWVLRRK